MSNAAYFHLSPELKCPDLGCVNPKAGALVAHYVTVRLAYHYTMLNPHLYNHRLTSCATREGANFRWYYCQ